MSWTTTFSWKRWAASCADWHLVPEDINSYKLGEEREKWAFSTALSRSLFLSWRKHAVLNTGPREGLGRWKTARPHLVRCAICEAFWELVLTWKKENIVLISWVSMRKFFFLVKNWGRECKSSQINPFRLLINEMKWNPFRTDYQRAWID